MGRGLAHFHLASENGEDSTLPILRSKLPAVVLICIIFQHTTVLRADPIQVRYLEGVTLGFLVLRNTAGQALAYGELSQAVNASDGVVTHDLHFRFKDGSWYQEVTKFTQHGEFRLISDRVVQKGPSFKQESETWIDAASGDVKVRVVDQGKEKITTRHFDLPADVANGLLFVLVKNLEPEATAALSMIASSGSPRLVTLNISSAAGKTVRVGSIKHEALHYVVKVKINGIAGVVAPLVGKQPPDFHIWVVKSGVPTFIEFDGQLSPDSPVWQIQLAAPQPGPKLK